MNMLVNPISLILFLIGISLILYVIIKNIIESKKEKKIVTDTITAEEEIVKDTIPEEEISTEKATEKEEIFIDKSTAKFEVFKDKAGEYRFRLKAPNGEIIAASSEGYKAKKSCMNGIKSVKKNVLNPKIVELKK